MQHHSDLNSLLPIPRNLQKSHTTWTFVVAWSPFDHACTCRLSHPSGKTRYLKMVQKGSYPSIKDELERLQWAADYLPVPKIIDQDINGNLPWFLTEGIEGLNGTEAKLKADPENLFRRLACALRFFHDHASVESCPFDFRLDTALKHISERAQLGLIHPEQHFHPDYQHFSVDQALAFLHENRPPKCKSVVCHGDYCVPNILFENNQLQGFVDLGELGVADVWWDFAVATWSLN